MNLKLSPDDLAFRERARTWLLENKPDSPRPPASEAAAKFDRDWQKKLFAAGWAGVNWPKAFGGLGASGLQQAIWYEEIARTKAPSYNNSTYIGLMHAGPTLIVNGTDAQKDFHLRRILSGDVFWCQGFSEPGAGSDLANISTRAVVDGNDLVVTGQKMWTSNAQHADYQELLVRTEPGSRRHAGLTWVIADMHAPGIEIKPIKTMMGESHVNMVFYNEVRIPLSNVVGRIGDGWRVAMSTLSFERGTGFIGDQLSLLEKVEAVIQMAGKTRLESGKLAIDDEEIARKLGRIKADTLAIRAMTLSGIAEIERRGSPGPEGSMMKLYVTSTYKALSEAAADVLGWNFFDYGEDRTSNPWTYEFMWSWVLTIAGGSSEIQREIIADRVLGLPRSR